jgi:hypothetical protein
MMMMLAAPVLLSIPFSCCSLTLLLLPINPLFLFMTPVAVVLVAMVVVAVVMSVPVVAVLISLGYSW